jgi:hypothetical protein
MQIWLSGGKINRVRGLDSWHNFNTASVGCLFAAGDLFFILSREKMNTSENLIESTLWNYAIVTQIETGLSAALSQMV